MGFPLPRLAVRAVRLALYSAGATSFPLYCSLPISNALCSAALYSLLSALCSLSGDTHKHPHPHKDLRVDMDHGFGPHRFGEGVSRLSTLIAQASKVSISCDTPSHLHANLLLFCM
jgi:hypothetical protein